MVDIQLNIQKTGMNPIFNPTFPIQTKERIKDFMKVFIEFLLIHAESIKRILLFTTLIEIMDL